MDNLPLDETVHKGGDGEMNVDYEANNQMFGGHLENIPEPHIYKWPGCERKRTVTVRIMRWPGNPHYHVSVNQEDNPVWNSLPKEWGDNGPIGWTVPWRDYPGKGMSDLGLWNEMREFNQEHKFPFCFRTHIAAVQAVEKLVEKVFPDHEINWKDFTGESEKLYIGKHGE